MQTVYLNQPFTVVTRGELRHMLISRCGRSGAPCQMRLNDTANNVINYHTFQSHSPGGATVNISKIKMADSQPS